MMDEHYPETDSAEGDEKPEENVTDGRGENTTALTVVMAEDPCPGCYRELPVDQFSRYTQMCDQLDDPPPYLCDQCATYGVPKLDPLEGLTKKEREAMMMLAAGEAPTRVAKKLGVDKKWLTERLNTRDRSLFREAFANLMVSEGLGPMDIIQVMKKTLHGKRYQWDPVNMEFAEFDDLNAQLRTAELAIKLLDLKPPQELARNVDGATPAGGGGVHIHLDTNIGDGKEAARVEYEVPGVRVDE